MKSALAQTASSGCTCITEISSCFAARKLSIFLLSAPQLFFFLLTFSHVEPGHKSRRTNSKCFPIPRNIAYKVSVSSFRFYFFCYWQRNYHVSRRNQPKDLALCHESERERKKEERRGKSNVTWLFYLYSVAAVFCPRKMLVVRFLNLIKNFNRIISTTEDSDNHCAKQTWIYKPRLTHKLETGRNKLFGCFLVTYVWF